MIYWGQLRLCLLFYSFCFHSCFCFWQLWNQKEQKSKQRENYWPWNLFKMNISIGITSYSNDCTQFLKIQRWKENLPSNLWFIEGSFGFVCFNILSDSIAVSVSDSYGIRKNKKATYIHDKIYNKTRKMPFMEIFLFAMGCFRLVRLYFSTNTIN